MVWIRLSVFCILFLSVSGSIAYGGDDQYYNEMQ